MRHLKRFNEALEKDYEGEFTEDSLDEIKDYCEVNLAYLLDMGMTIDCCNIIDDLTGVYECEVELKFGHSMSMSTILDHVIPFFKRIKNDYELGNLSATKNSPFYNDFFRFDCSSGHFTISHEELDDVDFLINSSATTQRNIANGFNTIIHDIKFYIKGEK